MNDATTLTMIWSPGSKYEHIEHTTFEVFAAENDPDDVALVAALVPGAVVRFGGGSEQTIDVSIEAVPA